VAPAGWPAATVGQRRQHAAASLLGEVAPGLRTAPGDADLVVACPDPGRTVTLGAVDAWVRTGQVHLIAELVETVARLGPLVRPGVTACVRCLHLHRRDRDPDWPLVAAQLAGAAPSPAGDAVLAATLAGHAALAALAVLDRPSQPTPWDGAVWEVRAPYGALRERHWVPHPACGCRWPAAG